MPRRLLIRLLAALGLGLGVPPAQAAPEGIVYRTVTQEFHTASYYLKGLLKREVTADAAGNPYLETEQTFVLRDVTTGGAGDATSTTATVFPQLARTDRRYFEGQSVAHKATHTLHDYDDLGNVVRYFDAGDAGAGDDVEAYLSYSSADPGCQAKHIVGVALGIDVIGDGRLMRSRSSRIDCARGNITQLSRHLEAGQAAVTDLAYDPYGNLSRVTGPRNHAGQRYALDYEFDPVVATHITRISDSFGYSSTATHHYKYGKVETTTDLNNQKTTYVYDTVGRASTLTGPYEQGSGQATIRFDYHPEAPVPYALTRHVDKTAAGALKDPIETLLFTDGLKRVLQTKKDLALFAGPDSAPLDSMSVSGRVLFDFVGRANAQYYPVTEPKGANTAFNPGFDAIPPTRLAYDVLDRNVQTTLPDGTTTTLAYGFGADRAGQLQFETVVTDANGKQKKSYRDVRELITAVLEFNPAGGQPIIWTSYQYDPLKQIVQVIDDQFNTTAVAYDSLGRRTVIDNPDTGRTEHVYDLADNLTAKITARLRAEGKQIRYAYDYTRLKAIGYPDFPENDVAYAYGPPGAAENAANRLTRISSEAGVEERGYGPLGELTRQTWTINSDTEGNSANSPELYETRYRYDTWNRLMQLAYPDGETLTYRYDSGGLVDGIDGVKRGVRSGYLKRLEYDKFEQRAFLELGNQIRTAYAYDPYTRRLCALDTGRGGGAATACPDFANATDTSHNLQALAYRYDNVGNILGLRNTLAVPPPKQYGGPSKQTFAYDDLYRLTGAEGVYRTAPNKTRSYRLDLAYDSIHNLTSKQQADVVTQPSGTPVTQQKTSYAWTYAYNPSGTGSIRPHAPIHIGDRTYAYDANGNQTGWDHDDNGTRRNIVWDEENRIQSVFDNGHEKAYKYDDAGSRVIKRGPQGETVYVNPWYTIRDRGIATKHVWAGASRLASRLVPGAASGGPPANGRANGQASNSAHPGQGAAHRSDHARGRPRNADKDFPGQGLAHRSATADLHAQNTERNPHFAETGPTAATLPTRDNFLYYYHPDHLGSSSLVTDADGKLFEHLEYFPFGETWVEESTNTQRTPYRFTGKELDEETGLYYFGARYYDPRTSVWQSADRILPSYLDGKPNGGVYNSFNLGLYSYSAQNPVTYRDPDGNCYVGGGRVDCFKYQWDIQKQLAADTGDAFGRGDYLGATAGFVLQVANTANVAAALVAQGVLEPGNATYAGTTAAQEGRYGDAAAQYGSAGLMIGMAGMASSANQAATLPRAAPSVTKGAPQAGDKVYRVWGDGAGANGRSWSRTDPRTVENYRDAAGLPNQNSGRFVTEGTLTNTKGVTQREALPLHGNKGGLDELVVPDPAKQIRVDRVSGANPEF